METQTETRLQPLQGPRPPPRTSGLHPSVLLAYTFPSTVPPSVTVGVESLRLRRVHQGHSSNYCLHPGLLEVAHTLPQALTRKSSSFGGSPRTRRLVPGHAFSRPPEAPLLSHVLSVWGCRWATRFTPPPRWWGWGKWSCRWTRSGPAPLTSLSHRLPLILPFFV